MNRILLSFVASSFALSACDAQNLDASDAPAQLDKTAEALVMHPPVVGPNSAPPLVSAGNYRTYGAISSSTIKGWGKDSGNLGIGSLANHLNEPTPVNLSLSAVKSIHAGSSHACAVILPTSQASYIECWGENSSGQLGLGAALFGQNQNLPQTIPNFLNIKRVAAGVDHTCALREDGTVSCWGSNYFGQIGNAQVPTSNGQFAKNPVPVLTDSGRLTGITALAAGHDNTCAVNTAGQVLCWGRSDSGVVSGPMLAVNVPTLVQGVVGAISIAVGDEHACALLTNGTVKCWGSNYSSQLGASTTPNFTSPIPLLVQNLSGAISLTADGLHSCALLSDGTAKCWGSNMKGQLGNGVSGPDLQSLTPEVVLSENQPLTNIGSIDAGSFHTCAKLLSGEVRCWGSNADGALGIGTADGLNYPSAQLVLNFP